jgi:hypothetical protein
MQTFGEIEIKYDIPERVSYPPFRVQVIIVKL